MGEGAPTTTDDDDEKKKKTKKKTKEDEEERSDDDDSDSEEEEEAIWNRAHEYERWRRPLWFWRARVRREAAENGAETTLRTELNHRQPKRAHRNKPKRPFHPFRLESAQQNTLEKNMHKSWQQRSLFPL